jgi:hypothetical protein
LVEELLNSVLARLVKDTRQLDAMNLRFQQRTQLVRALWPPTNSQSLYSWTLIDRLNSLRNALAHSLDRVKRTQKIDDLLGHYLTGEFQPGVLAKYETADRPTKLLFAVGGCLGFLAAVRDDIEEDRTRHVE